MNGSLRVVDKGASPAGALSAANFRLVLPNTPRFSQDELYWLRIGLGIAAAEARTVVDQNSIVVIELEEVICPQLDYQPEGLGGALIGLVCEHFHLAVPNIQVRFDATANRYIFQFPDTADITQPASSPTSRPKPGKSPT